MTSPVKKKAQELFLKIRFYWASDNWSESCLEEHLKQTTTEGLQNNESPEITFQTFDIFFKQKLDVKGISLLKRNSENPY